MSRFDGFTPVNHQNGSLYNTKLQRKFDFNLHKNDTIFPIFELIGPIICALKIRIWSSNMCKAISYFSFVTNGRINHLLQRLEIRKN